MTELLNSGALGAAIGGFMSAFIFAVLFRQRNCPDCGALLPRYDRKCVRSAWWGGWICPRCGCATDRFGRKLKSATGTASR